MSGSRRHTPLVALALALLVVITACSGDDSATTTTSAPTTSSVTSSTIADTSTTTEPATTTSSVSYFDIEVTLDDGAAQRVVSDLYGWLGDPTRPTPAISDDLASHLRAATVEQSETLTGTIVTGQVGDRGSVGVVTIDDDIVLLADEGTGWQVVGAWIPRYGLDPWFGDPQRYVLVIGTDARPGQDQQNFRADSLHILASNIIESGGGILGIPRDTYVEAPYGNDKFTNVNVYSGQQVMVDITADLSGLPIEGYIVTGFLNFQRLINDFGGVLVDVPFAFNDWRADAFISAGLQRLWGDKALGFSRSRRISGGDFTRSYHQGVVMEAALAGVQERDLTDLPALLALLDQYTWTDLSLGDLTTIAAGAFLLDPDRVGNRVLPGSVTSRGGASVVVLSDGAEDLFRDLDDGILDPDD